MLTKEFYVTGRDRMLYGHYWFDASTDEEEIEKCKAWLEEREFTNIREETITSPVTGISFRHVSGEREL